MRSVDHFIRLPITFHRNEKSGEFIQRIAKAEEELYEIIEDGIFHIIPNILTTFMAFSVILWIRWELALLYLVFIIFYLVMTVHKTVPIIIYQKNLNRTFERIYGNIFDCAPNIVNVKANTAEDIEYRRNLRDFNQAQVHNFKQVAHWTHLSLWQSWITAIGFMTLFAAGLYFVQTGAVSIGQFVILLTYINMVSLLLGSMGEYYKKFQEGIVALDRSEQIFTEKTEDCNNPKAVRLPQIVGEVKFHKVHLSYPEKPDVLNGVSFTAHPGQMIAIVGKSGQGKSTIINLLSRYLVPTEGMITVDGIDIRNIDLGDLRRQIAIVSQDINLFNDTIKNNLRYANIHATDQELMAAAKLAHCHEFIKKFPRKYDQVIGDNGAKLSTGQKQRLAIARAILRDPRILILDEATSALDSESEHFIQQSLEKIMKGRTTFVVAHRLSTIRKADLILVIENGKIVERGDHRELVDHGGVYKKLSSLQRMNV